MAHTLEWIEGFDHEVLDTSQFGGSGQGVWDTLFNTGVITYVAGRLGGSALNVAQDGVTAAGVRRVLPASQQRVQSVYFKAPSAPSVNSDFLVLTDAATTILGFFGLTTGTGTLRAKCGTLGTTRTSVANVCDNAWHRLDFWLDTSCTTGDLATWVMKWQVDGVAGTDATVGSVVATDSVRCRLGTATNAHTANVTYDDLVSSATAADYPIGPHHVVTASPTSDGTHNAGTNIIEDQVGNDIGGGTPAWSLMDDMPVASTTDYVRQQATGSGNYAAVKFAVNPADTGEFIDGVMAWMAGNASTTTAETGNPTTRIVNSGGTTLVDLYSGDMSETGLHYRAVMVPAPSGPWDNSDFNGIQTRVGFRADAVGGHPRWHALWMTVAVLEPSTVTKTHTTTAIVSVRSTKTHTSDARIGNPVVSKSHTTTAIIRKPGILLQHTSGAEITGGAARRVNDFEGGANGTTISTGNSGGASGDAFQDLVVGAGSTLTYDSTRFKHGAVSARADPATTVAYVGYTTSLGTQTNIYGRAYVRLDALPTQGITIALAYESGQVSGASIGINNVGRLRLLDSANVQQAISPNNATGIIPALQWVRLEWHFFANATTGSIELRLYLDPDSLVADSTTSATNINTLNLFNRYRVGKNNSTTGDEVAFNMDAIGWDTADWLGLVSDAVTKTHTTTAIIKATAIKTHSTTAIIRKQATLTHTTDARILLAPQKTHTSDAIIKALSTTRTHTSDAYIFKPATKSHSTDALLAGGFTPPANAWVVVDVTSTLAAGTVPIPSVTDTLGTPFTNEGTVHGVATSVRLSRFYAFTGPAPLPRSILVSFGGVVQARVLVEVMTIQGVDRTDPFVTTFPASFALTGASITYDVNPYTNAANRGLFAAVHLADEVSNNEAGWTELNDLHGATVAMADAWSDAEDDSPSYTWASTVGGILGMFSEIQVLHTGASLHTSDAIIQRLATTKTHTTTAIIRTPTTKSHTTTAIIVGTQRTATHTTDAFLIGAPSRFHTTTAVIKKTLTKTHTSDAIILSLTEPPPPVINPYTPYRMALAERSTVGLGAEIIPDVFGAIGVLEKASTLVYEEELNSAGRLEFSLPIDHALVTRANFAPGQREIYLYRGDTEELVWGGVLEIADVRDWEVRFVALGFYDLLARRTIKQDYSSRSVFQGPQLGWTYLDQFTVVRELVNLMQAESSIGLTFQDPTGLTGVTRKLTICTEERRLISDVIEEFAAANNGFDFAVTPDKKLQLWFPRRASGAPTIAVDGTASFAQIGYAIDAADMVTQVSGIGPTEECDQPDVVMKPDIPATDAAVLQYGILDGTIDLQHNADDDHRQAIVEEALQEGDHPRFQTTIEVPTQLPSAPDPSSYQVGDTITVNATRGAVAGFGYFTLQARILKRRVSVKPPGIETVELTIDVESFV